MNKAHNSYEILIPSEHNPDASFEHGTVKIQTEGRYVEVDVEIDAYLVMDRYKQRDFLKDLQSLIKKYAL